MKQLLPAQTTRNCGQGKGLLAVLCLSLQPFAYSASVDWDALKLDVVQYCKAEPSSELSLQCMVDAGRKVNVLETAANEDSRIVPLCAQWSSRGSSPWYHLLNCVSIHYPLLNNNPYPQWAEANLRQNEFRSEWVARCLVRVGSQVSACVSQQEMGFNEFWRDYLNLSKNDKEGSERIIGCVGRDLKKYDFSQYAQCKKR